MTVSKPRIFAVGRSGALTFKIYRKWNSKDDKYICKKLKPAERQEYFKWLQLLIDFLELAIKKNSKIEWSV